jgi:hypothetical protein
LRRVFVERGHVAASFPELILLEQVAHIAIFRRLHDSQPFRLPAGGMDAICLAVFNGHKVRLR